MQKVWQLMNTQLVIKTDLPNSSNRVDLPAPVSESVHRHRTEMNVCA